MVHPDALQALKLCGLESAIGMSALETKANGRTIDALRDITIKMFETRRHRPDTSEVFHAEEPSACAEMDESLSEDQDEEDHEEAEI